MFGAGNQGNRWISADITLSGTFSMIYFEATAGVDFKSDIALDDLTLYPDKCYKGRYTTTIFVVYYKDLVNRKLW